MVPSVLTGKRICNAVLSAEIRTSCPNEFKAFGLTLARLGPSWKMDGKCCKGNVRSFPHSLPEAHLIVPVFCCEVSRCSHKTCVWAYFRAHAHHCCREGKPPNAEGGELVTWPPCHGGAHTRCAIDCAHLHNFFGIKLLGECFCVNRFSPVRKKKHTHTHSRVSLSLLPQSLSSKHWQKSQFRLVNDDSFPKSSARISSRFVFLLLLNLETVFKKEEREKPDKLMREESNSDLIIFLFLSWQGS